MSFGTLIRQLAKSDSPNEIVDAYKVICEWLSRNSAHKESKLNEFVNYLLVHMSNTSTSVRVASLKACGYLLKSPSIKLSERDEKTIMEKICFAAENPSKTLMYHACWCFAVQKLSTKPIEKYFDRMYNALVAILEEVENKSGQNESMEQEALEALLRLCEQCPGNMKKRLVSKEEKNKSIKGWIIIIAERFVGRGPTFNKQAQKLFVKTMDLLINLPNEVVLQIAEEVKNLLETGIIDQLADGIKDPQAGDSSPVDLLRIWGYFIILLNEKTLFKTPKLLNQLLAIAQGGFLHTSKEIQLHTFLSWKYFILVLGANIPKLIRNTQRLSIALKPLIRALTKNTIKEIREEAYNRYVEVIYLLSDKLDNDKQSSVLFSSFDDLLKPLFETIIQNPLNKKCTPDLFTSTIQLFGELLKFNEDEMDAMEEKEEEYDIFLLLKKQNSENEESKIKRNVEISEEIINQRTAMFLQIIAAGFNDEMSQNDDFRSLLLTLWSNLIHRIAHNLNLQKSSSSLRSIKQILIFPFSLPKTSQYLCDKWDVNSREELVRGIINTIKATMIISKQFQLSLRRLQNPPDHSPPPSKIPIILFLACCWIQSVKEGLSSSLSSPFLSSSQLSLFELILSTIRSNATPSLILDYYQVIIIQLLPGIPGQKDLLHDDFVSLYTTFGKNLVEYLKESSDIGVGISNNKEIGHNVIIQSLLIPFSNFFSTISHPIALQIVECWKEIFKIYSSIVPLKSNQPDWQCNFISKFPAISTSAANQLSIWSPVIHLLFNQQGSTVQISSSNASNHSWELKIKLLSESLLFSHNLITDPTVNAANPASNVGTTGSDVTCSSSALSGDYFASNALTLLQCLSDFLHKVEKLKLKDYQIIVQLFLTNGKADKNRSSSNPKSDKNLSNWPLLEALEKWFCNPKPNSEKFTQPISGEIYDKIRNEILLVFKYFSAIISNYLKVTARKEKKQSELISKLEKIFIGLFTSKFRWLKNVAIEFWNENSKLIIIPSTELPAFTSILNKLKGQLPLNFPTSWEVEASQPLEPSPSFKAFEDEEILDDIPGDSLGYEIESRFSQLKKSPPPVPKLGGNAQKSQASPSGERKSKESPKKKEEEKENDKKLSNETKKKETSAETGKGESPTKKKKAAITLVLKEAAAALSVKEEKEFLSPEPIVRPKKQPPLTEHQKEKRREQSKNKFPFGDFIELPAATLSTQDISDELWNDGSDMPPPSKKRKFESGSSNIFKHQIELNKLSSEEFVELIREIGNDKTIINQLSVPQLFEVQRSANNFMKNLIDQLHSNEFQF